MIIIDDAIDEAYLREMRNLMLDVTDNPTPLPWYPKGPNVGGSSIANEMTHVFKSDSMPQDSGWLGAVLPILYRSVNDVMAVYRVKANLGFKSVEPIMSGWHIDTDFNGKPLLNAWTGIFYINDNNGKTIFKDGAEVESRANRFLMFPNNTEHCGVSSTDTDMRVLINFGFYRAET